MHEMFSTESCDIKTYEFSGNKLMGDLNESMLIFTVMDRNKILTWAAIISKTMNELRVSKQYLK